MTTNHLGACAVDECSRPATRSTSLGNLCEAHRKRQTRNGTLDSSEPVKEQLPLRERLRAVALEYAQADEDADYARAEGELDAIAEALAKQKLVFRRLANIAEAFGSEEARRKTNESIAQGLARARASGTHIGRPRALTFEQAAAAVAEAGSIAGAARALGVHAITVTRTLKGTSPNVQRSAHGTMHRPPSERD